ncbi:nuclear transport factor 2 family protein [Nocardioides endophyticus]
MDTREPTPAQQLEELWVRTKCIELGARYCHGVDHGDLETFLSIWHPGGEYIVGKRTGRFAGHAELATALDFVRGAFASTHHWTTNHLVTRTADDAATGVSDSFAICVDHSDRPSLVAATYDDEYRLGNGEWKILRRTVRRWLVSEGIEVPLRHPASEGVRS